MSAAPFSILKLILSARTYVLVLTTASSLLSQLSFAQGTIAPSRFNCLQNFDATFLQARSALRAYNCKQAGNLVDCEWQMGVGTGIGLALGGAGIVGGATALSLRDPNFGMCGKVARGWFMEIAVAATACNSTDMMRRWRLDSANRLLQQDYKNLIEIRTKEIQVAEQALMAGQVDTKKKLDSVNTELKAARTRYDEMAKARGLDVRKLESKKKEYDVKNEELERKYKAATGKELKTSSQLDELKTREGRAKFPGSEGLIAEVNQLDSNTRSLELEIERTEGLRELDRHNDAAREFSEKINRLSAEAEELKKTPSTGPLTPEQKKKITVKIEETKAEIANIEKSKAASIKIGDILSTKNGPVAEDIDDAHQALKELATGNPKIGAELSMTGNPKGALATAPGRSSRRIGNDGFFKNLSQSLKSGSLKKVAFGSVLSGFGFAANAASSEIADALDPISALFHSKSIACSSQLDTQDWKLFPVTEDNDCRPDLRINENTMKYLNMDKDEMRAAIQEYPEICEFIATNARESYPKATATCSKPGAKINFDKGARVEATNRSLSLFAGSQTKSPVIIRYDLHGNETHIGHPRAKMGKAKDSVFYDDLDLRLRDEETREDHLAGIYGDFLPVIAEAKACCSSEGMRPSDGDCMRYGIRPADRPASPSGPAQDERTGTR